MVVAVAPAPAAKPAMVQRTYRMALTGKPTTEAGAAYVQLRLCSLSLRLLRRRKRRRRCVSGAQAR
jgi:hypothetical protein